MAQRLSRRRWPVHSAGVVAHRRPWRNRRFDPVQVESVTFTGPSADTLMLFLSQPGTILDFDVGLVPGVFLGSFLAALLIARTCSCRASMTASRCGAISLARP